jgi:hypothetical protein
LGAYQKPKKNLHREFVYLNHEVIINSLSAFEAGQVDEILERTNEASEGGFEAGVGFRGAKVGGNKKRQGSIQEELVRTRTLFSAFESWYQRLREEGALGTFSDWDMSVRDEIEIGETIQFFADIRVSPLFKLVMAYMSFASNPAMFGVKGNMVAETKKNAKMMESWVTGQDGTRSTAVYLRPNGVGAPRVVGRLSDKYLIAGLENIEETYSVVAQVRSILGPNDNVSLVRVLKDAPPVPVEVETVTNAMRNMQEGAKPLGVFFGDDDLMFSHPDVIVQPLAIFK